MFQAYITILILLIRKDLLCGIMNCKQKARVSNRGPYCSTCLKQTTLCILHRCKLSAAFTAERYVPVGMERTYISCFVLKSRLYCVWNHNTQKKVDKRTGACCMFPNFTLHTCTNMTHHHGVYPPVQLVRDR